MRCKQTPPTQSLAAHRLNVRCKQNTVGFAKTKTWKILSNCFYRFIEGAWVSAAFKKLNRFGKPSYILFDTTQQPWCLHPHPDTASHLPFFLPFSFPSQLFFLFGDLYLNASLTDRRCFHGRARGRYHEAQDLLDLRAGEIANYGSSVAH